MSKLEKFNELGVRITWKLIDLGFKRSDIFKDELSTREIIDYAISIMIKEDNVAVDIIDLACEYDTNVDKINKCVKKLAEKENAKYEFEYRKWRVIYVLRNLPNCEVDFINGLIELGDIWVKLGFPSDSPHLFQGRHNDVIPDQYYTQKNYDALLHRHIEWIKNEIGAIKTEDVKMHASNKN